MTAITTRHRPATPPDTQLLRVAVRADATLCAGLGLVVAMAADPLSRLSGLTATGQWIVGATLVAYGALLYSAARLRHIRRVGLGVLAGNVAFIFGATVVLAVGLLPLTPFGVTATAVFIAITAALSYLQYLGVSHTPS